MKFFKKKKPYQTTLIYVAAFVIIIAGLMAAQKVIIPILIALFISIVCAYPVMWMQKKGLPNGIAILIMLTGILVMFFGFGGIVGNSLSNFSQEAPKYEARLKDSLSGLIERLNEMGISAGSGELLNALDPGKVLNFTALAMTEIGALMSESFLILLIAIFILSELKSFWVKAAIIEKAQGFSLAYLDEIGQSIRHYLSIKTLISAITGILIMVWLMIIGVDYPILWGLIAFLLNYIPNIGSIIAAVPTMLLAMVQLGMVGVIWTAVGYFAVNVIMGNVIEPKVMGKGLGLSTLVVFLSLIVWGFVFGTVGMFLSVPLTMSIKIILATNEKTKWIAIMLGTEENATAILEGYKK